MIKFNEIMVNSNDNADYLRIFSYDVLKFLILRCDTPLVIIRELRFFKNCGKDGGFKIFL